MVRRDNQHQVNIVQGFLNAAWGRVEKEFVFVAIGCY